MNSEWGEQTLDALCLLISDCPHATPKWTESGVIVLRNQNIKAGRLDLSNPSFTDEAHYINRTQRAVPEKGDIVITREAPMGDVCIIPEGLKCCLGQRQVLLRPNPEKVENSFLLYALQSPYLQHQIGWNEGTGSTVSNLRIPVLKALKVPIAPLSHQKQISKILRALDDRITLLRETNKTLESIAQAIFKSWFVDFDPVRAKMEGRQPEGMDEDTAALFPDSFEETEIGKVPRGWGVGILSDICTIMSGKRPPDRSDTPSDLHSTPLYGGAGLMGYTSKSLFDETLIVTGRVGTLGKVHIAHPPFWASDNVLVLVPKPSSGFYYAFHWIKSIDTASLNRGSTQPLLTQKDLGQQKSVTPTQEIINAFEEIIKQFYRSIESNELQSQNLASLRDTLLPRLISGQLRLPEAQEQIETALS